jgi:NADPH:quinone reductase
MPKTIPHTNPAPAAYDALNFFGRFDMHAWLCENPIGVDALTWKELPTPAPKAGEVLIAIKAASLNFPDILIVQNKYQIKPALPFVPGSEYAGVVEAVGEGVKHLKVGQHVAALSGTGGFATHTIAPSALCMPLSGGFPFVDAAAFIMIYATSYHALIDRAQLKAGETVLVLGAAGGVGTSAIQIAKAKGARVIAAASTQEKCDLCKRIGADATINYTTENLRDAIKALTDGKGPDVIYDPVGGDFAEPAFRSIAWRGRYLVVGFASGPIPALPFNLALLKGASIVGVFWGDFAKREPQANGAMMVELAQWYGAGKIKPVLDRTMPMAELKAAYAHMGSRGVMGKLVMVND